MVYRCEQSSVFINPRSPWCHYCFTIWGVKIDAQMPTRHEWWSVILTRVMAGKLSTLEGPQQQHITQIKLRSVRSPVLVSVSDVNSSNMTRPEDIESNTLVQGVPYASSHVCTIDCAPLSFWRPFIFITGMISAYDTPSWAQNLYYVVSWERNDNTDNELCS